MCQQTARQSSGAGGHGTGAGSGDVALRAETLLADILALRRSPEFAGARLAADRPSGRLADSSICMLEQRVATFMQDTGAPVLPLQHGRFDTVTVGTAQLR